jgi:malate dehydrogenase (oxaloacetate-decarboxylating)
MATQQLSINGSGVRDLPHGMNLLNHQGLNKGTVFTEEERSQFGLDGLI